MDMNRQLFAMLASAAMVCLAAGCAKHTQVATETSPASAAPEAAASAAAPASGEAQAPQAEGQASPAASESANAGAAPASTPTGPVDLLTFTHGAIARSWPPTDISLSAPTNLLEGAYWRSAPGANGPYVFVFELAQPANIDAFGFITNSSNPDDPNAAQSVSIEGSTQSATSGYSKIGDFAFKSTGGEQTFPLSAPATVRWLRLSIAQRAKDFTTIEAVNAYGKLNGAQAGSLAGMWFEDRNLDPHQDALVSGSSFPSVLDRSIVTTQHNGMIGMEIVEHDNVIRAVTCTPGTGMVLSSYGGTQTGSLVTWDDQSWEGHPTDFSTVNTEGTMMVGAHDVMIKVPGDLRCETIEPPIGSGQNVLVFTTDGRGSFYFPASRADLFPGFRFTSRAVALLNQDALAKADTAVLYCIDNAEQRIAPWQAQALTDFVKSGHKLIVYDADKCGTPLNYSFLPYQFKTSNPGAQGANSKNLYLVESNTLGTADKTDQQHFWDPAVYTADPNNQIGDANTVTTSDPHWCGHLFGTNVLNVNGFMQMYALLGRGLIIYDGFDQDNSGLQEVQRLELLELRQPVPAALPCSSLVAAKFVIEPSSTFPITLGRAMTARAPMQVLANQGYSGTVMLSSSAQAGIPWKNSLSTTQVSLKGNTAPTSLSIAVPADAQPGGYQFTVTGRDAAGNTASANVTLVAMAPQRVMKVKPVARGCVEKLTLGADALFAFGEATLTPTAQQTLALLGPTVRKAGKHPVHIFGYTDSFGSDAYNQALSEQRARSVRDWLAAHGYVKASTTIEGYGKQHPVAPNTNPNGSDNPLGRAKNRRVEVLIDTCK
jgi:outer membrane protein OmpA-like peptidoglycan-associated protein